MSICVFYIYCPSALFNIYLLCNVCLCECVCHFVSQALFPPSSSPPNYYRIPLDRRPHNRPKYKQKSVQSSGSPRLARPDKAEWYILVQCFLVWRLLKVGWLCFSSQLCKLEVERVTCRCSSLGSGTSAGHFFRFCCEKNVNCLFCCIYSRWFKSCFSVI